MLTLNLGVVPARPRHSHPLSSRRHTRKKFENPHDAGLVFITSSGFKEGSAATLVSRKRVACSTTDEEGSWICIDVGRNQ